MGMSAGEREALLTQWIKPSSDTEKDQQERAERMVNNAVDASSLLKETRHRVYAKGSYPNSTNVRRDSDVDIVVELFECIYYDFHSDVALDTRGAVPSYKGDWVPG